MVLLRGFSLAASLLVTLLLCIAGYRLGKHLKKRPGPAQVLTEKAVSTLYNLVSDTMGPHNAHWTPYIGTLFLSSLCGSLIGMTGFLRSTTADLSTGLYTSTSNANGGNNSQKNYTNVRFETSSSASIQLD